MTTTNGKPLDLAQLREQRKAVRARLRLAQDKQLLEALSMWDDFGGGSDLYDRIRPRSNDGPDAGDWLPLGNPSDRRHGSNWPLWRQQSDLDRYRQEARVRCQTNSFAKGLLKNLVNQVIGKGYQYKASYLGPDGKPLSDLQPDQEQQVRLVQDAIDGFLKLNHWNGLVNHVGHNALAGTREREVYRTVLIDGECFLRFHFQANGKTLVRLIDASNVRDGSTGHNPQSGWTYGIQHQMEPFEDVESLLSYAVFWPDPSAPGGSEDNRGTWEEVDASEVLHLKGPDTPSNVKRGLSAFLFDTGRALDRAAKLQRNASIAAAIRAAIAETWQYDQSTQAQISSMQQALAERSRTNPVTGKTEFIEKYAPGMVRRGPIGATLIPPSPDNTQIYLAGVQGDLQEACAAVQVPSFTIGDVASGNYSNYESASFPPVVNAQCEQEYYKAAFAKVIWRALTWAIECGKLPSDTPERITIQVEAPAVLHRNELEKAQEDQIGIQNGWKDRQTCAAERGIDWKQVEANNTEYQDSQMALSPLAMPGEEGEEGGPPKGPGGPGPKPPGQPMHESKDSTGHEHKGKGEGGGQFTSTGGGGGGGGGKTKKSTGTKAGLPKNRKKLTIQQAAHELKQQGYEMTGKATTQVVNGKFTTQYEIKTPSGETIHASPGAINDMVYSGGGGGEHSKTFSHEELGVPKDPSKLTIQQSEVALDQLGYKLGKAETRPHEGAFLTSYEVQTPSGETLRASPGALKDIIYKSITK